MITNKPNYSRPPRSGSGIKDNRNLNNTFKDEYRKDITRRDRARLAKTIAEMHDRLGHDKFNTLIKIFMFKIERKKEIAKEIKFNDIKTILEDAIKIADEIYGNRRCEEDD